MARFAVLSLLLLSARAALAAAPETLSERFARVRNNNASAAPLRASATADSKSCSGTFAIGALTNGEFNFFGCSVPTVKKGALYDAQEVSFTLNPFNRGPPSGYDDYVVYVVPSCAPIESNTATPLNGDAGTRITAPFTSTTYSSVSTELCIFIDCANVGLSCDQGTLVARFALHTNGGVVAGIVIGVLATVALIAYCCVRARRGKGAGAGAEGETVYNAAAGAPSYQQQQPQQWR